MRGERSRFSVESRFFGISLEDAGGKLFGRIFISLSLWIRFDKLNFLDGVEACCRDENGNIVALFGLKVGKSSL